MFHSSLACGKGREPAEHTEIWTKWKIYVNKLISNICSWGKIIYFEVALLTIGQIRFTEVIEYCLKQWWLTLLTQLCVGRSQWVRSTQWSKLPLQWPHDGRDGVSNHMPHYCLLNRLFRGRSKKTSKFRATGLCAGNSPVTGEFPAQMVSNAKNVSIWWRRHVSWH